MICDQPSPADDVRLASTDRARSGRAPLTAMQQGLAARYLPMARALAKPLKKAWPNAYEEFESAACLALVEAAESFDPSRNVKFATFARHRIWGALRDVQRQLMARGWRNHGRAPSRPRIVGMPTDYDRRGFVLGIEPPGPVGAELEAADEVEALLRKLPARHAVACRQIYLHGKTQNEAARLLGCSQSRLSYMHREALDMLNGSWYDRVLASADGDRAGVPGSAN
jgi:RNA polymerase sigma factor (sigma-70 family)